MSADYHSSPGYVAHLIECQAALVRALNTAMNRLGEVGCGGSAALARRARDEALAIMDRDPVSNGTPHTEQSKDYTK